MNECSAHIHVLLGSVILKAKEKHTGLLTILFVTQITLIDGVDYHQVKVEYVLSVAVIMTRQYGEI